MGTEKKLNGQTFSVSSLDKIFFPKSGYTKGDLIEYYERISEFMLPHIKDRMITMIRFPNGIDDKKFFQKDTPEYFPDWIETKCINKKDGGETHYVICNKQATLVYLANQACITPHIWLSKKDKPNKPDRLIFDLDPEKDDFPSVKVAAKRTREMLEERLGLPTYIMTTGSRGLHIVVPLKRTRDFDEVRDFAQKTAELLEKENPDLLTTAARKNKREDKIFVDVGRNAFAQTGVAPYAVRPIEGAPVATPLDWEDLDEKNITPQSYNIKNIFQKLDKNGDPWKDIDSKAVVLTSAEKELNKLLKQYEKT